METAGWLQRQRDAHDERRVRVTLTDAGRALKTQAAAVPACVLARSQCTVQELQALTQQIQQLRDRLTAPPSTASL